MTQKIIKNQNPKKIMDLRKPVEGKGRGKGIGRGRGRGRGGITKNKKVNINLLTHKPKVVNKQQIV